MAATERAVFPTTQKHVHPAEEVCPTCEQPIPRDKYDEIQEKIRANKGKRDAEIKRTLRAEFAREKSKAVDIAREEGKKAAENALTERLNKAQDAKATAESKLKAVEKAHKSELAQQRKSLENNKTKAVLAERAERFKERQKLDTKVADLQRQLANKTAEELGEGAELDLFEKLKEAFEADRIRRVARGTAGADIVHEVLHNGKVCGKIVYDSKNHKAWRNHHAAKLRADQIAERADHAILSTNKFPAGAQQLHRQDGVIVACPARVVVLAEFLRDFIIQTHELRASSEQREEKTAALYAFITSERFSQLLDSIESDVEKLEQADVTEQKAHTLMWEKRASCIRRS